MRAVLMGIIAAGAVAFATPALAQSDNDICSENMNNYTAAQVIASCTALINTGRYDNNNMAILYSNRGSGFRRAGDLRSSMADHDRAIQYAPTDAISYFNRGNTRRDLQDYAGAVADYDLTLRYQPGYQRALYERGFARYKLEQHPQAIADFNQAIALNPNDGNAYVGRANSYIATRDYQPAIADLNQAVRLRPTDPLPLYNRGVANERADLPTEAIRDYTAAIALDPRHADALGNRGNVRAQQGDADGGVADLNAALAIRETVIDTHNRGHAYAGLRDYNRALVDFDRAAVLDRSGHEYDNDRCWYRLMANRELNVARAACDRGVAGSANDPSYLANILDSRGLLNLKEGRFQDAFIDYDRAAQLLTTNGSYPFGRGVAALRLGRAEEARADFARAMAIDPQIASRYAGWGFAIDASLLPGAAAPQVNPPPPQPTPISSNPGLAPRSAPPPSQAAAPPTTAAFSVLPGRHVYSYQCASTNQVLRITLDGDDGTALIARIRRPNVTLRAQPGDAENFRYTNDSYELRGNFTEVFFRTGAGEPVRCPRGG